MTEEKKGKGRPSLGDQKRVTYNTFIEADHEAWLDWMKINTGKSWGEIIDDIVRKRMAADVQ